MDGLQPEQAGPVALRLLERVAPATDDRQAWANLPSEITAFRAGSVEFCRGRRNATSQSAAILA
jgi:hypothetical protein